MDRVLGLKGKVKMRMQHAETLNESQRYERLMDRVPRVKRKRKVKKRLVASFSESQRCEGSRKVRMRTAKEDVSISCGMKQPIDLVSAVKELHALSTQELSKLIRDAESNNIQWTSSNGSAFKIHVESLARYFALHLIAKLISSELDEELFRYLLGGFRLLHTLCDLTSRHSKLEQVLLDDVKVSEQMLDLIFYMIVVLGGFRKKSHASSHLVLMHSALVACSLYLLTSCISSHWHELAQVLLAHLKVDIFMSAAFAAVRVDICFLQVKLSSQLTDSSMRSSLAEVNHLCQHCEASLQFLQSLCQQKLFRERVVKNKELCGEGGVLLLAQDIMKLPLCEEPYLMAAVSRLKSKALSILLNLCEVETPSFLDVAASTSWGLNLAKSTIFQVIELLRSMFRGDLKRLTSCSDKNYPRGLLQLNAMRVAEILSDDSNFRSFFTINFTEVLITIFSLPHGHFVSSWCSSDIRASEEDATLDYDSLAAAGWVLGVVSSSEVPESTFNPCHVPRNSYAHQRTSLLVKVVANLTCFIPDICKEEKDLFLNKFLECLQKELPTLPDGVPHGGGAERAAIVNANLRSLLIHAESLIPGFLNEDDVQLLRLFIQQLEPLIARESNINMVKDIRLEDTLALERLSRLNITELHQETHDRGQWSSPTPKTLFPDVYDKSSRQNVGFRERLDVEVDRYLGFKGNGVGQSNGVAGGERAGLAKPGATKGIQEGNGDAQNTEIRPDSSTMRLNNSVEKMNMDFAKSSEDIKEIGTGRVPEDEKNESLQNEEKQLKKRKRNIMNDTQIAVIEKALQDEPDMQRKAASIQLWADKLSLHGSEVTSSQLKNWLNNRKAKLARAAAKDVRAPSGGDNALTDKQGGSGTDPVSDSPESPADEFFEPYPSATQGTQQKEVAESMLRPCNHENSENIPAKSVGCEKGQYVMLTDGQGEEIGKGCVHLAKGTWFGSNLEDSGLCVVDVTYLKVDKWTNLPHPCDATGNSFAQAEQILGRKRVLWDSSKLLVQQQPR